MGIGSFAQGALGAIGSAAQAKARNRARIQNYEYQLEARKRDWHQQLSVWGAKRNKYHQDLDENDMAAQRGYTQAQQGLNDVFAKAAQSNEKALIQFLQKSGKGAAAGRTGRSAYRREILDIAALERHAGRNMAIITRSEQAFRHNVENIRNQQKSQRNKLYQNVAFAPVPDMAPPPPQMENQSPMMGILGAAIGGITSYAGAKLSSDTPTVGGGGTGESLDIPYTGSGGSGFNTDPAPWSSGQDYNIGNIYEGGSNPFTDTASQTNFGAYAFR